MKVALIGYGKMGREVERIALQRGHTISGRVDPETPDAKHPLISASSLGAADVGIEFTNPGAVLENIRLLAALKTPVVVGTTGWTQHLSQVEEWVGNSDIGLVYAPNFSLGVNLFYHIIARAAGLFQPFNDYDVSLSEAHHRQKQDSPSGTAKKLIEIIRTKFPRKKRVVTDSLNRAIEEDELHVTSLRAGHLPGVHSVIFDSPSDTIELTHTVRSRAGFASGAVLAAEWIRDRKGLFTFEQVLTDMLGQSSVPR